MDVAFKSFVGIDIAKRTLDVHVLPEGTSLKQPKAAGNSERSFLLPESV